jgi:hypothetical protein
MSLRLHPTGIEDGQIPTEKHRKTGRRIENVIPMSLAFRIAYRRSPALDSPSGGAPRIVRYE